jgi:ligand-binding sensor domain-containing protein/signal transduction histidine kinase
MKCHFQSQFSPDWKRFMAVLVGALAFLQAACAKTQADKFIPQPVVGRNADGLLEVFKTDHDGELRHRWQKESDGDWSSWSSLGGSFQPGMTVANDVEERQVLFAIDRETGALQINTQKSRNSHDWSGWRDLEGELIPPVAVGRNANGQLEVFGLSKKDGALKHIWQTNTNGDWSDWENFGEKLRPSLVVAGNIDGRLELFGVDAEKGSLVHRWQLHANAIHDWSKWEDLGSSILPGFAVGRNVRGRLEVFAVNSHNNEVQRLCQLSGGESAGWSSWLEFGGDVKDGLTVENSADGRMEVFAIDQRHATLLHRWETLTNGSDLWSPWTSMEMTAQGRPAAGRNEDGNLEVFAVDQRNTAIINHRKQISSASDWLDWTTLDRTTFQYTSRTWQMDEGLPDNCVLAIAQTSDGYLWVGTSGGLARFDAMHFTVFNQKNTPALPNASITALCADPNGGLWIGTDGSGLLFLKDGIISRYTRTNGLPGDTIKVLLKAHDNSLWIGTTSGMSHYKSGEFKNYHKNNGLLSEVVSYICEDRDDNLWIATGAGLNRLKGGEIMDSFKMPNGLPNDSVRGVCQDRGGRIWIGSNNGMLWYNWYWTGSFYAYNTRYGLSDTFVSAILEDREGNLWVGTYSGLNRFREGRFYNELDNEGVPYDRVNALFEDNEGNLWVGTKQGLVRRTPKRFFSLTKKQGLSHNNVTSVVEDQKGSLWIGTWGGGINQIKNERIFSFATTNVLSRDLILSTCAARDGCIWIGADYDGGLTRIKGGKSVHYSSKDGLIDAGIRVILEDRSGSLWLGTSKGVSCFKDGKFINYFHQKDNLAGDVVRAICEDREGNLWFGTDEGLSLWKKGRFTSFTTNQGLADNTIFALHGDRAGNLWIGTGNGGLTRYAKGHFTNYNSQQGLFSNEIFEILEDDLGWLWMSCSKGIFRVRKQNLDDFDHGKVAGIACIAYGKNDGMESPQCNNLGKPAGYKTGDGRLWFSTSKGLVRIDPKTVKLNQESPPVYIEQVIADKNEFLAPISSDAMSTSEQSGSCRSPIKIPPGRGDLELQFTSLNLQAPEKSHVEYKLEGINPEWVDAGTQRSVSYHNVPPGHYRFRVIASNNDGVWNRIGASLDIVMLPHLWETWWFRASMGLMVIGTASGTALQLTRRKMKRKLQLLEQKHAIEKERGRIAKDIHDDLGSSLTRIMMLGERAEEGLQNAEDVGIHVQKIVTSARNTVQSLDEIVWAVNPENDTLDALVEYISHYTNEFFENTDVSCRLEMPVTLPGFVLPAEVRHHLFLVVKEAFNNTLKHSQATSVRVQMSVIKSTLSIAIEDNGCGFALNGNATGRRRNGLDNMRKRIEALGGRFSIESAQGKGTKITFAIELKTQITGG